MLLRDVPVHRTVLRLNDAVVELAFREGFSQAEVSDLHPSVIFHQDIAGSEVSMDVSHCVQVFHALWKKRVGWKKDLMSDFLWNSLIFNSIPNILCLK